jgi:hypothetical protein
MIETITLDTRKDYAGGGNAHISPLRRGERNNVRLTVVVLRDSKPYDLTGMTAHLVWKAADGKLVGPVPMDVTDTTEGIVSCILPEACYSAVGMARAYIELRGGEELVDTTDEMLIKVLDCIDADGVQAEEYKTLIVEVKEATDAAIKAAASAESGEDGRVKAETSRASAETAREQAETERTNGWANLKADAQAAIAEVKATEANLYPAAENVLVGSETGTVAHVEDAFAGAALREITVEGACKQDGTPSPDNPVPIHVIENPVLRVTGRNLVDVPDKTINAGSGGYIVPCGLIPSGTEIFLSFSSSRNAKPTNTSGAAWGLYGTNNEQAQYVMDVRAINAGINRSSVKSTIDASSHLVIYGYRYPDVSFDVSDYQLEIGDFHDYRPYVGTSTPITLPSEHPYLAKLPDGTADEITVDRDGNAELVARVGKSTAAVSDGVGGEVGTDALSSTGAIADGAVVYYKLATPVTYPLGEVIVPSLPDSISNVWTDAEVTPNTGIEYVRDVNIVVANLEAAIASITEG